MSKIKELGRFEERVTHLHVRLVTKATARRLSSETGGQHAEEGALIATMVAVGAGVVTQGPKIGEAIGSMWSKAFGG